MAYANLHYKFKIDEYHAVRTATITFDICFLTNINIYGNCAQIFLHCLLVKNIAKLKQSSKALYTGMLNASGGVIDDLVVYYFNNEYYRLITNSATRKNFYFESMNILKLPN
ncbi:MAG: hypothetical protein ACTS7E_04740 [Arsenophonus sp. NC-CH8-MAG3]